MTEKSQAPQPDDAARAGFETFCLKRWAGDRDAFTRNPDGTYWLGNVEFAWCAYQAALAAIPAPEGDEPTCFGAGDVVRIRDCALAVFHGCGQEARDVIEWYHSSLLGEVGVMTARPAQCAAEAHGELIAAAKRVSWKFGHDDAGTPSDWTEWANLRAAIAAAETKAQPKGTPVAWVGRVSLDWLASPHHGSDAYVETALRKTGRDGDVPIYAAAQAPAPGADLCERICAAIKATDDKSVDDAGYMLDSNDCIKIVREQFAAPTQAPAVKAEPVHTAAMRQALKALEACMEIVDGVPQWHNSGHAHIVGDAAMSALRSALSISDVPVQPTGDAND